ncbi:MAG: hypothetical protein HYZ49_14320 [Chloroflexi bacterium]|nr:hypothetical protein [Chloroflexota bacterium]
MGENFWGDVDLDGDADWLDDWIGDSAMMAVLRARRKLERGEPLTKEEAELLGEPFEEDEAEEWEAGDERDDWEEDDDDD